MPFDKKILGLIPARGGSKGIPGKNKKILGGHPLIAYSIAAGLASEHITDLVVSTDDKEIMEIALQYGAEVPFQRPSDLATDETPTIDVVIHALETLAKQGKHYDAVCLLQPTSPFRKNGFIDESINKFLSSGADSLLSVLPVPHEYNPHWVFENSEGLLRIATGEEKLITRRQELPEAYLRDGSIYLTKASVILDQRSLFGNTISYLESEPVSYINIDDVEDWKKAEDMVSQWSLISLQENISKDLPC
jgi:CMP-N,N'-diacetyllegionaminic acid synthase